MSDVVVSAGTYHYGFERLMQWTETWLAGRPSVHVTVQHGTSRRVPGADNRVMVPHPELLELYRRATVVVLQGGAGGIMDARQLGIKPVVVPRVPVDNEVVDMHQVVFSRRLHDLGLVHLAEDEPTFHTMLDAALSGQLDTRSPQTVLDGVSAVSARLDALLTHSPIPRRRTAGRGASIVRTALARRTRP